MSITIDASILASYYAAKSGVASASSTASGSTTAQASIAPTPPWSTSSTATQQSALVKSVLAGTRFINPTAAQLNQTGVNSQDYKNLFALYQGLNALNGVAKAASASNLSAGDLTALQSRFSSGLKEVDGFLATAPFSAFTLAQGKVAASQQTTITAGKETDTYTTPALFTGTLGTDVPAFQGDVKFDLKLTKLSGTSTTVSFDLSDLGSQPRTIPNVVNYLNGKLAEAGAATRFANVRIPAVAQTVKSGDSTITLPTGQDSFALKLVGTSAETPTFSALAAAPAVYITSTSGRTAAQATTALPADATQQLAKFNGDQDVTTEDDGTTKIFGRTLPANVSSVGATATGPDGSLYVLANVTGSAPDGQTIKGSQDVALLKYDSAGALQFSRTLGASDSAAGFALAVSGDGKSVAVSGTTTTALDGASGSTFINSATTNTFTTVFSSAGDESWTSQRVGSTGTQPTAISFAPDGSVYVVGKTGGSVQGGAAIGGGDGWLQAFSKTGAATYTSELGSTSADKAAGVSADANGVVVASVENGHAVLRRYDFDGSGKLQPGAVKDLGDLQGGDIAGLGRADDGSLIVAGSTHNGALDAGAVNADYTGGREAFVANLSADLQSSSDDTLSYVDLGADATTSGLTVSGGKAYITGQLTQDGGGLQGYGAAIDPTTGALGWHDTINGADGLSAPTGIAVSEGGASILDKLGLPSGVVNYGVSTSLTANTSIRAGDQFSVRAGTGAAVPVTVAADDTLATLAVKINRALGFQGKAEVITTTTGQQLKITPINARTVIQVEAGKNGTNALSALGLSEGLITDPTLNVSGTSSSSTTNAKPTYGLKLPSTVSIANVATAKQTAVLLASAMTTLQLAYSDLAFPASKTSTDSKSSAASQPVSQYETDKIANYQLALARLTGSG